MNDTPALPLSLQLGLLVITVAILPALFLFGYLHDPDRNASSALPVPTLAVVPPGARVTPAPTASATPTVAAAASPAAPSALTLRIGTPNRGDGILYDTDTLRAPRNTVVTVIYTNDTTIPHNWHLFAGKDATAPTIVMTAIKSGPNDVESVTFRTPTQPGSYFFHCDVHPAQMTGHLIVS